MFPPRVECQQAAGWVTWQHCYSQLLDFGPAAIGSLAMSCPLALHPSTHVLLGALPPPHHHHPMWMGWCLAQPRAARSGQAPAQSPGDHLLAPHRSTLPQSATSTCQLWPWSVII